MLSLLDVLHEVPLLLDLMPSSSLAALVAVSQAHRGQIQNYVTRIAIPHHDHLQTLFRGVWPRLESWQIDDRLRSHPAGTHMLILWPKEALCSSPLTLCEDSSTAADVVAQLHCVSGSTLKSCRIKSRLSCAGIHAFCTHTWPALRRLDLHRHQLDAMAISHLAAASWPCLTKLGLSRTGLTHAALQHLCSGCWPALTHLDIHANNLSSGSISLLSSPPQSTRMMTDWASQLKELYLSSNLTSLDPQNNSLTASAVEDLTKIYWPRLEVLSLIHIKPNLDVMSHLLRGRWPKLSDLNINGQAIGDAALQMLAQAPWRHLRFLNLTANLQNPAVCEQLIARSQDHDQQLSRCLQLYAEDPWFTMMLGHSPALSKGQGYAQVAECFAQWQDLTVYVWHDASV